MASGGPSRRKHFTLSVAALSKARASALDAVSSRAPANRRIAMDKMLAAGARSTSAEMALFEMLEQAGGDEFKAISKLVR